MTIQDLLKTNIFKLTAPLQTQLLSTLIMQILCYYENNCFRNNSNTDEAHAYTAEYGLLLLFRCCPKSFNSANPLRLKNKPASKRIFPKPSSGTYHFQTPRLPSNYSLPSSFTFEGVSSFPRERAREKRAIAVAGVWQVYTSGYRGY